MEVQAFDAGAPAGQPPSRFDGQRGLADLSAEHVRLRAMGFAVWIVAARLENRPQPHRDGHDTFSLRLGLGSRQYQLRATTRKVADLVPLQRHQFAYPAPGLER